MKGVDKIYIIYVTIVYGVRSVDSDNNNNNNGIILNNCILNNNKIYSYSHYLFFHITIVLRISKKSKNKFMLSYFKKKKLHTSH